MEENARIHPCSPPPALDGDLLPWEQHLKGWRAEEEQVWGVCDPHPTPESSTGGICSLLSDRGWWEQPWQLQPP